MHLIQAKRRIAETPIIMSGEIDMSKRANKNKLINAALIAVAIPLSSCGRVDAVPENGTARFRQEPSAESLPAASFPLADAGSAGDAADLALPTLVERRHFAIYSTYRVLFDDSPDVFQSRASGQGEGVQQTVLSDGEYMGGLPGCSMRALLTQD
jgi:hypothetical protein